MPHTGLDPRFRPTAYSAALLSAAVKAASAVANATASPDRMRASALEVGVGGGIVAAALLQAGVPWVDGVDILP